MVYLSLEKRALEGGSGKVSLICVPEPVKEKRKTKVGTEGEKKKQLQATNECHGSKA